MFVFNCQLDAKLVTVVGSVKVQLQPGKVQFFLPAGGVGKLHKPRESLAIFLRLG